MCPHDRQAIALTFCLILSAGSLSDLNRTCHSTPTGNICPFSVSVDPHLGHFSTAITSCLPTQRPVAVNPRVHSGCVPRDSPGGFWEHNTSSCRQVICFSVAVLDGPPVAHRSPWLSAPRDATSRSLDERISSAQFHTSSLRRPYLRPPMVEFGFVNR